MANLYFMLKRLLLSLEISFSYILYNLSRDIKNYHTLYSQTFFHYFLFEYYSIIVTDGRLKHFEFIKERSYSNIELTNAHFQTRNGYMDIFQSQTDHVNRLEV